MLRALCFDYVKEGEDQSLQFSLGGLGKDLSHIVSRGACQHRSQFTLNSQAGPPGSLDPDLKLSMTSYVRELRTQQMCGTEREYSHMHCG